MIKAPVKNRKFRKSEAFNPKNLISMGSVKIPTIISVVMKMAITG